MLATLHGRVVACGVQPCTHARTHASRLIKIVYVSVAIMMYPAGMGMACVLSVIISCLAVHVNSAVTRVTHLSGGVPTLSTVAIVAAAGSGGSSANHRLRALAAKELRRYVYATTGAFPMIIEVGTVAANGVPEDTVLLATVSDIPRLRSTLHLGVSGILPADDVLHALHAQVIAGGPDAHARAAMPGGQTLLLGGSSLAVLYAAYEFATTDLGVQSAVGETVSFYWSPPSPFSRRFDRDK